MHDRIISIDTKPSDNIHYIKLQINNHWDWAYSIDQQTLFFGRTECEDNCSLSSLNIREFDTLVLTVRNPEFLIMLSDEVGGGGISYSVRQEYSFGDVVKEYIKRRNIPLYRLHFQVQGMNDYDLSLEKLQILSDKTIDVTIYKDNGDSDENMSNSLTIEVVESAITGNGPTSYQIKVDSNKYICQGLMSFAKLLNVPLSSLYFEYNGQIILAESRHTSETLGMKENDVVYCFGASTSEDAVDLFVLFRDGVMNPGLQISRNSGVDVLLARYAEYPGAPLDYYRFTYNGKLIPNDLKKTLDECEIEDCSEICVELETPEREINVTFEDIDGVKTQVKSKLGTGIWNLIEKYCRCQRISTKYRQFTYRGRVIPDKCSHAIGSMGVTESDVIKATAKNTLDPSSPSQIMVNIKDEHGKTTPYSVRWDNQVYQLMDAFSASQDIPMDQMWLTYGGEDIPTNSNDTILTLGIKDKDTLYAAKKTTGTNLTENSIKIIFDMSSSEDNPSFKPHLQITDAVASHSGWRVSVTNTHFNAAFETQLIQSMHLLFSFSYPMVHTASTEKQHLIMELPLVISFEWMALE